MDRLPVSWRVERCIGSGRSRHLLFFLHDGSANSLARRDQTDVGISAALHSSIGFFGHLNAVPPDTPYGNVCPVARLDGAAAFPCSTTMTWDDLGPLYTPAVLMSASRDSGALEPTAYLFGSGLSASLAYLESRCLRAFNSLTMSSDSSASPDRGFQVCSIVRKASHPQRSALRACFRRIPAAKRRTY